MRFTLNGTKYWIDEFQGGFAWISNADESMCFSTALEAQADAIRNEHLISTRRDEEDAQHLEDELYGTYREQVNKLYYATR